VHSVPGSSVPGLTVPPPPEMPSVRRRG
jgi:hypothetical protein